MLSVMVALSLFPIVRFGSGVADSPLQVGMTLATLIAVAMAYVHCHRGAVISDAVQRSAVHPPRRPVTRHHGRDRHGARRQASTGRIAHRLIIVRNGLEWGIPGIDWFHAFYDAAGRL